MRIRALHREKPLSLKPVFNYESHLNEIPKKKTHNVRITQKSLVTCLGTLL